MNEMFWLLDTNRTSKMMDASSYKRFFGSSAGGLQERPFLKNSSSIATTIASNLSKGEKYDQFINQVTYRNKKYEKAIVGQNESGSRGDLRPRSYNVPRKSRSTNINYRNSVHELLNQKYDFDNTKRGHVLSSIPSDQKNSTTIDYSGLLDYSGHWNPSKYNTPTKKQHIYGWTRPGFIYLSDNRSEKSSNGFIHWINNGEKPTKSDKKIDSNRRVNQAGRSGSKANNDESTVFSPNFKTFQDIESWKGAAWIYGPRTGYITHTQDTEIEKAQGRANRSLNSNYSLKISMKVDVIGASKSLKGKVPPKNKSLDIGDFGDDAGMMFQNSNCCFIALSDGAGGNRKRGIDPSIFSRNLMASCYRILCSSTFNTRQLPQIITKAMKKIENLNILGSATVCLVGLDRRLKLLHTLNIGDSGVKVIRKDRVVFRSRKTMNGSSPCQLFLIDHTELYKMGVAPTSFISESEIRADSSLESFPVEIGDIIVMSSDGLWDVIEESTLLNIISSKKVTTENIEMISSLSLAKSI